MVRRVLLVWLAVLVVSACSREAESRASAVPVASVVTTTPDVETAPSVETAAPPVATSPPATSPDTSAPAPAPDTTVAPTSAASTTAAPTTAAPTTAAPTTAPATVVPTTAVPATIAPPAATTAPCRVVTSEDRIRSGDCGEVVTFIQERLTVLGFPAASDGLFGPGTETAVKNFQTSRGLVADGIVGPLSWAALFEGGIGD